MERKGFIGGSDCVKIMKGEWLELWQVKTGRAEPEDMSRILPVQLGIWTEEFNLKWFEHEYQTQLIKHQLAYTDQIGIVPVKGTIDAAKANDDGSFSIVEAKHTNSMNNMDGILDWYMPQIHLYMKLSGLDGCYLSIIFGNSKWESAYVSYNAEYFHSMWAVVSDFWGYVLRDEEPVGVDTPTISIDKIAVDNMVKRDASKDNAFVNAAQTYVEYESAAKTFEGAKKDLKAMVDANEREVYCDQLTIKRDKRGALRITTRKATA